MSLGRRIDRLEERLGGGDEGPPSICIDPPGCEHGEHDMEFSLTFDRRESDDAPEAFRDIWEEDDA